MHVRYRQLAGDAGPCACCRDAGTLPTLLAQRMVAYPTLVEDAEDDDDTTAFRRRVKDTIPVLAPSPAAAESKVPCASRLYATRCIWQLCGACVVLFGVLCQAAPPFCCVFCRAVCAFARCRARLARGQFCAQRERALTPRCPACY